MYAIATPYQSVDAGGSFFGGLLVLFGIAGLLMHFGWLPAIALWKLWPLLFVWHGFLRMAEHGPRLGSLIWLTLGATVQAYYFGLLPSSFDWKLLWPLGVIALGLHIWTGGDRRQAYAHYGAHGGRDGEPDDGEDETHDETSSRSSDGSSGVSYGAWRSSSCGQTPTSVSPGDGEPLRIHLTMSGREDRFQGRTFAGGSIRCVMAGYQLDLRDCELRGDSVVLDVDCFMGGIELRVPATWRVDVDVDTVVGGLDNATRCPNPETAPRLIVRGKLVLSGVEIRN
ncbi:MAG TPA: hypothetical protein VLC09_06430 [Polyangiaceae bacterium]|nr:hypothetical protein [Polyangiaceae bacterium]